MSAVCQHGNYVSSSEACGLCRREQSALFDLALRDIRAMRRLMATRHGCDLIALYGDDGELQCKQCGVDFKRFTVDQILERWEANGRKQLEAMGAERLQELFGRKG